MCELHVGLPDVKVVGLFARVGQPLRVHIETRRERPACRTCGVFAHVKDRQEVELIDLPSFGRSARLVWRKRRWCCPEMTCPGGSSTEEDDRIAAPRLAMTDRAGRWVTEQVGRYARTVNEVAVELGCDWHTINDTVIAYGTALVDDDPLRYGIVHALGLDEVLFVRLGLYHRQHFTTSIVDVEVGQLLDIVPGRSGKNPAEWIEAKSLEWRDQVRWATLDLSGPYRAVFDRALPNATQVADPFHVVQVTLLGCSGAGKLALTAQPDGSAPLSGAVAITATATVARRARPTSTVAGDRIPRHSDDVIRLTSLRTEVMLRQQASSALQPFPFFERCRGVVCPVCRCHIVGRGRAVRDATRFDRRVETGVASRPVPRRLSTGG